MGKQCVGIWESPDTTRTTMNALKNFPVSSTADGLG